MLPNITNNLKSDKFRQKVSKLQKSAMSSYFGDIQVLTSSSHRGDPFFEGIPASLPLRMKVKIKLHSSPPGIAWVSCFINFHPVDFEVSF